MKRFLVTTVLAALSGFTAAQLSPLDSRASAIDSKRAEINAERTKLESGFTAEDIACHKRFFVNNCLGKVDDRRRTAVAELRRQEIALNDEDRKIRGEQALLRIEEKSSPENLQQAADQRAKGVEDYQTRLAREKEKQQGRAAAATAEKAAREASAQRLVESQKKAAAAATRKASAAEEALKFNERQKQAAERRAQHEKEQLAKPPATSRSLPLPN